MKKYYDAHGRKFDKKDQKKEGEEMKEEADEDDGNEGSPLAALIDKEVQKEIENFKERHEDMDRRLKQIAFTDQNVISSDLCRANLPEIVETDHNYFELMK